MGIRVRIPASPPYREGAAEWSANGPENRGRVTPWGSTPPPSPKFGRLGKLVKPVVPKTAKGSHPSEFESRVFRHLCTIANW